VRLALRHGGHEAVGDARQMDAELGCAAWIDTTHQVVLLIGHDPRARRRTVIPGGGGAEVSGLHRAIAVVTAVDLAVAIVEAAPAIDVLAVDDPVHPLGLVV